MAVVGRREEREGRREGRVVVVVVLEGGGGVVGVAVGVAVDGNSVDDVVVGATGYFGVNPLSL